MHTILYYKNRGIDLDSKMVSWIQKYAELYLSTLNHPSWFIKVLENLKDNFCQPHGKYFFDERIIDHDHERLKYCIEMLCMVIAKMEANTKRHFFEYIQNEIKNSWCDAFKNRIINMDWFDDDEDFRLIYVGSLKSLKAIMLKDLRSRLNP